MKRNSQTIELRRLAGDSANEVSSMLLELEGARHFDSEANPRWAARFVPAVTKFAPARRWPTRFLSADTKEAQIRK